MAAAQQTCSLSRPQNIDRTKIRRLFLPAKSFPVDTDQFVLLHQKIDGIDQSDSGVYVFLNHLFIVEWCVIKIQPVVLLQQAGQ